MKNASFKIGSVYSQSFIGDSSLEVLFKCFKRTSKTVWMTNIKTNEVVRRRIKIDDDINEYILDGNYSMAPVIRATKEVNQEESKPVFIKGTFFTKVYRNN